MQSRAVCANSTRQQLHCRAASCTLLSRSRRPAHTWRCPSTVNHAPRPLRNVGRCGYQPAEAAGGSRQQDVLHQQDVPQAPVMLSQQELLDFGATFVKYWFTGVAKGPAAVHQALLSTLHDDVVLKADSVRQDKDMQGLAEVLAELERSHLEYPHSTHQPILYAASPDKQRVYALVEGRYQDAGALPGHPATFRISRVHVVLALELQAGKVGRLWLRRQLTEEDKDELLHDPVHCYPIPFPKDHLQLTSAGARDMAAAQMEGIIKQWWHTWNRPAATGAAAAATTSSSAPAPSSSSSSHDSATHPPATNPSSTSTRSLRRPRVSVDTTAAGELLAEDFRMLDAYGLYSRMRARGRRHLNKESAMRFMQQLAYQYHIELQVEDVSAAEGSLCCFTHWRALLTPKFGSQGDSSDGGAAVSPAAARVTASDSQVATATANLAAGVPPGVAAAAAAAQAAEAFLHQQQPSGAQAGSSTPAGSSSGAASTAAAPEASSSAPVAMAGASADHSSSNNSSSSTVMQPAAAASHTGYILEGVEVDVFKEDLKLHDIWLFRGPLDSEQDLFLLTQQQAAEEQRQLEAAQQERLLQMRREQREQQLQELLTWMTSYQQQWAESIQHVQRVLQHHQRNLQEKGPSGLLDGYPLLPPTTPQPPSSGSEGQQAQAPAHEQQAK